MKIIKKGVMPNGVKVQLEDWGKDAPSLTIGAYPIARNSSTYGMIRAHEYFRLQISENEYANYSSADVAADYDALINGRKRLEDLAPHFWNGKKDEWYLGMIAPDTDEWYEARLLYGIKCSY